MGSKQTKRRKKRKRAIVARRAAHARSANSLHRLNISLAVDGDELPTEFRIFRSGWNESTKGKVLFDAAAAELTMSAYGKHATDLMIDLEHLSLDVESRNFDPDARAWCKLELRNGELWAVDVRWTGDGTARLSEKRQRYMSPAFYTDADKRVTEVLNIALTALPATHGSDALIAARADTTDAETHGMLTRQQMETVIAAIANKDGDAAIGVLTDLVVAMASDEPAEVEPVEDDAAPEELAEDVETDDEPDDEPEEDEVIQAASATPAATHTDELDAANEATGRALMTATGRKTVSESLETVETWRKAYLASEERAAKVAKDRAAIELAERTDLVKQMITMRTETPVTSGLDKGALCKRLADEPIAELRTRVKLLAAVKPTTFRVPSKSTDDHGLTAAELADCKAKKRDPEIYARNKKRANRGLSQ